MTTPTHNRPVSFDLSREEAWVLHAALTRTVDRALDAGETPRYGRSLVLQVEAGDMAFGVTALRYLADTLVTYLEDAPERDEAVAATLLERFRDAI